MALLKSHKSLYRATQILPFVQPTLFSWHITLIHKEILSKYFEFLLCNYVVDFGSLIFHLESVCWIRQSNWKDILMRFFSLDQM